MNTWHIIDEEGLNPATGRYPVVHEARSEDEAVAWLGRHADQAKVERGGFGIDGPIGTHQANDESDAAFAARLVAMGFYSVSNKYHAVARWTEPIPRIEDLIRPEMLNAPHVDRIIANWNNRRCPESDLRGSRHPLVERIEITPDQFALFRKAGGTAA